MLLGVGLVDLGGLEGVINLVLHTLGPYGEGAAQLGDALGGHAGARELVHLELHHLLLLLDHDGDNLVLEAAGLDGGLGLLLGGGGELVHLLTGDAPHVRDVLGGGTHVVVVVGIPEGVLNHGVQHLGVAHARAVAAGGQGVGSGGHVLGAAGHNDLGVAGQNGAGALDDALHAGTADHTHGIGGDADGDTGAQRHLAGHVLSLGGGENAAEHDLIHLLRLYVGALKRLGHDGGAQLGGGHVLQGAPEGANGSAAAIDNVDVLHKLDPPNEELWQCAKNG